MDRVTLGDNAEICESIIGRHVAVESSQRKKTRIDQFTVVADDVTVQEGCKLIEAKIYPHQSIRGEFARQTVMPG